VVPVNTVNIGWMGESQDSVIMEDDVFSLPSPDRASVVTSAITPHTIPSGRIAITTSDMANSSFINLTQPTASGSTLSTAVHSDHGYGNGPRLPKV